MVALQIKQAALGRDHMHVALIQWDLGVYKAHLRQLREAHFLLESACHVLSKHYAARDHPVLQHMHSTLHELERSLPQDTVALDSPLFDALKDRLDQAQGNQASRDLEHALFGQRGASPAPGETVQQLLNKYLNNNNNK